MQIIEAVITQKRVSVKLRKIRAQFKIVVDCGKKSGGGRIAFAFCTICQNIWGNSSFCRQNSNSVDSSYSRNGSSSMSHDRANSSTRLGGQDDFTKSDTEATFESSAKGEAHIRSTPVKLQITANKLENFSKTVVIKSSLHL